MRSIPSILATTLGLADGWIGVQESVTVTYSLLFEVLDSTCDPFEQLGVLRFFFAGAT